MNFFKRFGITFGNKKNKYLPESAIETEAPVNTQSVVTYATAKNNVCEGVTKTVESHLSLDENVNYRTLAMFDLKIDAPKYEGAIPEATIKFYPLTK